MTGRAAVALYAFLSLAPLSYRVATDFDGVGVIAIAFSVALVLWLRSASRTAWGFLLVFDTLGVVGGFIYADPLLGLESLLLLAVLVSPSMRDYVGVSERRAASR